MALLPAALPLPAAPPARSAAGSARGASPARAPSPSPYTPPAPAAGSALSPGAGDTPPTDRSRLILTIQRQTETLDKLHASLREHKDRVHALQRQLSDADVQLSRSATLRKENDTLRRENAELRQLCADYAKQQSAAASTSADQASRESELAASNATLERDLGAARASVAEGAQREQALHRQLADKDARIALLVEQLTNHGPPDVDVKLQLEQMRERHEQLLQQVMQQSEQGRALADHADGLKQRLEEAIEDLKSRDEVIMALEMENRAFKKNLSSLIATLNKRGQPPGAVPAGALDPPPLQSTQLLRGDPHADLQHTYDRLFEAASADAGGGQAPRSGGPQQSRGASLGAPRGVSPSRSRSRSAQAVPSGAPSAQQLHAERLRRLDQYQRLRRPRHL
eukprot:TRINITY_DN47221_c0_g1_i1.p1 TRINITY_DN47221_c0_g1~~TRINITY_DN47221_c0_g1_i1.p1  ORF type:complete len:423 (+),score=155.81 TRINITY_DN47221_c0_g1_i1:76-1269(+)